MSDLRYGQYAVNALKFDGPVITSPVDPTTVEAFDAAVGDVAVYHKERNFQNLLVAHNIARLTNASGIVYYPFLYNAEHPTYFSSLYDAYQVKDWGGFVGKYSSWTCPVPTDMQQLINAEYPIKFNGMNQTETTNGFWSHIYTYFANHDIVDCYYGYRLFANSNVSRMKVIFNPTRASNTRGEVVQSDTALAECIFRSCISLTEAELILRSGKRAHSVHEWFYGCRNMTTLTMTYEGSGGLWEIGEWSGSFSGCQKLATLPSSLRFKNTQYNSSVGLMHCQLNYAFEYSGLTTIGHGEEITVLIGRQAFNGCPNLTTVNLILDVQYLDTEIKNSNYENMWMMYCSAVTYARIKGINKGDWDFTGTDVTGGSRGLNYYTAGNCSGFDAASVNYILNNCYDLTTNGLDSYKYYYKSSITTFQSWQAAQGCTLNQQYTSATFMGLSSSLTYSGSSVDTMLKLAVGNMTMDDHIWVISNGVRTDITTDGQYFIDVFGTGIEIHYTGDGSGQPTITLINDFHYEVSRVTSANIYFPSSFQSRIDSSAAQVARSRGWEIYVDGQVY